MSTYIYVCDCDTVIFIANFVGSIRKIYQGLNMKKKIFVYATIVVLLCSILNANYMIPVEPLVNTSVKNEYPETMATKTIMTLPFEIKVLFDDRHAYYDASKLSTFVSDLENIYGFSVYTSDDFSSFDTTNITNYWMYILPNPSNGNLTEGEIDAVIHLVNETCGFAMIFAEYYRYLNYHTLNAIVKPFGVHILNASLYDDTNNTGASYWPLIWTWGNNQIAQTVSEGGIYEVSYSGTGMEILEGNTSTKSVWPIGIGDDDTYLKDGAGNILSNITDGDINAFTIINTSTKGMLFLSGSTKVVYDSSYYYLSSTYNNRDFILNVIEYSLSRDLKIVTYEAPTGPVMAGQIIYVNMTIQNTAPYTINNVYAGIEFSGALELQNGSNYVIFDSLAPGETQDLTFGLLVTGTSDAYIEFKTWSQNTPVIGYQRRMEFKTQGLTIEAYVEPDFIVLENFNETVLTININNPAANPNATNVNISVILPSALTTDNDTTYHYDEITNGTTITLKLFIEALSTGPQTITVNLESENLGTASVSAKVYVYAKPYILFDQAHGQYYTPDKMTGFVDLLETYGELYVNNETLTKDVVGNASMLIITNPDVPFDNDTELQYIKNFINNGGKLIIMGTWFKYINIDYLNNITVDYGILFNKGEIADDDNNFGDYYNPILYNLSHHPICADVEYLFAPSSTYLTISGDAVAIVRGNPTSYGLEWYDTASGVNGSALIAVAVVELDNGAKIAALGGAGILADSREAFANNTLFAKNLLTWLMGDTEAPEITIEYTISGDKATVTVKVHDNLAIDAINISRDDLTIKQESDLLKHNYTFTFTIQGSGTHTVKVIAKDYFGLTTTKEATIEIPVVTTTPTTTTTGVTTETGPGAGIPIWVLGVVGIAAVAVVVVALIVLKKKKVE